MDTPMTDQQMNPSDAIALDPWRRLAGTLRSYLTIVYGSRRSAHREIRRLNTLPRGITGAGYAARHPELALWVHATLIDSTIVTNAAWLGPLSVDRRAAFYAETRPIGRAFGGPESLLPADLDAFERYLAGMLAAAGPVRVSPLARELARAVLRPPLAPLASLLPFGESGIASGAGGAVASALARVPAGIYAWTLWPSVGLLPDSLREAYGLPWGVREGLVTAWLVRGWRAWRPWLPESFRQMPQARSADGALDFAG